MVKRGSIRVRHAAGSPYRVVFGRASVRIRSCLSVIGLLLVSMHARAYRPFSSTDADVAGPKELETELGYFTLERSAGEDTFIVPQIVLNYGLTSTLEVIGEFDVEKPSGRKAEIVDAAVLLKGLIREGVLQDQQGISLAFEAGVLLPSTGADRFGFEGIGIVSGRLSDFTYHLNFGGGLDRGNSQEFAVWGAILEYPLRSSLRLVGEINGESVRGYAAENTALLGFIWESPSSGDSFDGGIRWGISSAAPDRELTLGWTFSFPRK